MTNHTQESLAEALSQVSIDGAIVKMVGTCVAGINPELLVAEVLKLNPHNITTAIKRPDTIVHREGQMGLDSSLRGAFENYCSSIEVPEQVKTLGLDLIENHDH